ncbi:MAG: HEAT repeat domain-containing protein [Deltaproteobacteria bacterium]|nr:HEAT repeat domain-containing protein [Deltaproteobacteria bacterium]
MTRKKADGLDGSFRAWKEKIRALLKSPDFSEDTLRASCLPLMKGINALFPFLYHGDEEVHRRAVVAIGTLVADLADRDMDRARNVVRRLMWNLNDESGGIGWGSPEAMGEILARHEGLAGEYACVLASYTREEGNYLENEVLQRGLLWGIGRVLRHWPDLIHRAEPSISPYLASGDPCVRGLAAGLLGELGDGLAGSDLEGLLEDRAEYRIPMTENPVVRRVQDEAKEATRKLDSGGGI